MTVLSSWRPGSGPPMDLSILIVNYDTRDLLRDSLASIFTAKNGAELEVLVVDNHSRDGSSEMISTSQPTSAWGISVRSMMIWSIDTVPLIGAHCPATRTTA